MITYNWHGTSRCYGVHVFLVAPVFYFYLLIYWNMEVLGTTKPPSLTSVLLVLMLRKPKQEILLLVHGSTLVQSSMLHVEKPTSLRESAITLILSQSFKFARSNLHDASYTMLIVTKWERMLMDFQGTSLNRIYSLFSLFCIKVKKKTSNQFERYIVFNDRFILFR